MSDPVSNAEIEDVLSSIRRLVSENAAPEPMPQAQTEQRAEPAQEMRDKLVLTPAFRVHEGDRPAPEPAASEPTAPEPVATEPPTPAPDPSSAPQEPLHLTEAHSVPDVAAEPEAHPVPDMAHEDVSEVAAADAAQHEEALLDHVAQEVVASVVIEEVLSDVTFTSNRDVATLDGAEEAAELDLADPVEVSTPSETDAPLLEDTPDLAEPTLAEPTFAEPTFAETEATPDMTGAADAAADPSQDIEHNGETSPLDHRVAELEAAVNDSAVEFEPDLGDAVEDLGPGIFLRRRAEAEDRTETSSESAAQEGAQDTVPEAKPEPDTQDWEAFDAEVEAFVSGEQIEARATPDETVDEAILAEDEDTALLDEEMLRELVSRLVREELQGAVGEKITRNIRRLVRREVERALTLKSLE